MPQSNSYAPILHPSPPLPGSGPVVRALSFISAEYGLKGFDYLFGDLTEKFLKNRNIAKYTYFVIFLGFIIVGSSSNLGAVMDFSDMMILAMAFPNILGLLILAPEVKRDLQDYINKLKTGEIKKFK